MTLDVLLICAMKDEYDQVLKVTDGIVGPGWEESPGPNGWIVADGAFVVRTGESLRIRATWADHMGREQAQLVASMLIQAQPARCLAMSGICAGRREKVSLGDVIFADRLWSYDAGKITVENGIERFEGDAFQFHPPSTWGQRMHGIAGPNDSAWVADRPRLPLEHQEEWVLLRLLDNENPCEHPDYANACPDWTAVLKRLWKRKWVAMDETTLSEIGRKHANKLRLLYPHALPTPAKFEVRVAPIATGAAVTEDDGIFPRLSASMRKVLGVEMEASALGALGKMLEVPVIVAKGVSDYGDGLKDDRYRHFAARAAAECLIKFLRESSDLLRSDYRQGASTPR